MEGSLLENRMNLARMIRERKHQVCAAVLPDAYDIAREDEFRYVPESCHRRRRLQTGPRSRATSRDTSRVTSRVTSTQNPRGSNAANGTSNRNSTDNPAPSHAVGMAAGLAPAEIQRERASLLRLVRGNPVAPHQIFAPADELVTAASPEQYTAMLRRDACYKFLIASLPQMMAPQLVRAAPEPARRAQALMAAWQDGLLLRRGWQHEARAARRRLFHMVKAQYDAMFGA